MIIAPSFADIFYNNCFNNGILPIKLSNEQMDELFARAYDVEGYTLEVDLEGLKIRDSEGLEFDFEVNEFYRHKLLNGLDNIGLTLVH